ncbi:hypothetical protein AXG93_2458s1060 [Marchantia polymorpha subsp. ruderalis]|uniref:Uncharacterized protein n=1 Tax=Marchantia polymorpha subsp. ruderalis TaxID=1480154 RepID=A0A176VIN0_MARPO|nr:hypothetical protein AXG93_2458s1060 [Marchantia polymorpha subsp. ruderalis]
MVVRALSPRAHHEVALAPREKFAAASPSDRGASGSTRAVAGLPQHGPDGGTMTVVSTASVLLAMPREQHPILVGEFLLCRSILHIIYLWNTFRYYAVSEGSIKVSQVLIV